MCVESWSRREGPLPRQPGRVGPGAQGTGPRGAGAHLAARRPRPRSSARKSGQGRPRGRPVTTGGEGARDVPSRPQDRDGGLSPPPDARPPPPLRGHARPAPAPSARARSAGLLPARAAATAAERAPDAEGRARAARAPGAGRGQGPRLARVRGPETPLRSPGPFPPCTRPQAWGEARRPRPRRRRWPRPS